MKITIELDTGGPRIPYNDEVACADVVRNEFVDLRDEPESADILPELGRSDALRNAVKMLNSPQSMFRTYGCNYELTPGTTEQNGGSRSATAARIDAYLHIGFTNYCMIRDPYSVLSGRLATALLIRFPPPEDSSLDYDEVTLSIDPLSIDNDDRGFVLRIDFAVCGFSDDGLQSKWSSLISETANFLTNYDR